MASSKVLKALILLVALTALVAMACGTAATPVVIEKEVPVEVEVIKEVPVEVEKEVIREVIKEVPVITEVVKEVVKEVQVEVIKEVQVVREVEVPVVKVVVATPTPTPLPGPAAKLTRIPVFRVASGVFRQRVPISRAGSAQAQLGAIYGTNAIEIRNTDGVTFRYEPGLFQKWDVIDGGKRVAVKIAEGVQAHEGWGEYTAEDAAWVHDYFRDAPDFTGKGEWEKWSIQAEQTGKYTFEAFRGDGGIFPVADWIYISSRFALPVVKRYHEAVGNDGMANNPIGIGSMKFVRWGADSLHMEKVPNHYRADPVFDRLDFIHVTESATRAAMVITGKAHTTDTVELAHALDAKDRGMQIDSWPGQFNVRITFGGLQNVTPGPDPWADPKVRRAVALAIDADAWNDEFRGGFAKPLGAPWQTDSIKLEPIGYDLVEAKRLLAEAGYPDGFEVEVGQVNIRGSARVPQEHGALLTSLENLGLKVKGTILEWGSFKPRWNATETEGLIFAFSVTQYATPEGEWSWHRTGRRSNYGDQFLSDTLEKMDAAYVDDPVEFKRLEAIALQHIYDLTGVYSLYTTTQLQVLAPGFSWPEQFTFMNPQAVRYEVIQYTPPS